MKKVLLSILAIVYLGLSSGIAMEIHYCMGKTSGVAFFSEEKERCSKCGMTDKASGCCHDKHQFFKIHDAHQVASNDLDFTYHYIALPVSYLMYTGPVAIDVAGSTIQNHSPPNFTRPSACILYCVFRL